VEALHGSKVQSLRLVEKVGKKQVGGIDINKEKVSRGTLYFDDGAYTVKSGKLYRKGEKKSVGQIWMTKKTSSKIWNVSSLQYTYTDAEGQVHNGNLMDGNFASQGRESGDMTMNAGEGSLLWTGREKPMDDESRQRKMAFGGKSKKWQWLRRSKQGYITYGGGTVTSRLKKLKKEGKLDITDEQIKVLQGVAAVESYGQTQTINSWDSDKMSVGFKQYTMAGKIQKLIKRNEAAFADYGIELERDDAGKEVKKTIKEHDGKKTKATWLKGMEKAADLRNSVWAMRFYEAGMDERIIIEQAKMALEYYEDFEKKADKHVKKGKDTTKFFQENVVKTALFEISNNRPAYVDDVIRKVQKDSAGDGTVKDFLEDLMKASGQVYVDKNSGNLNGKTEKDARDKGQRIVWKVAKVFGHKLSGKY
ncbi:MAG: hypothetical protein AAF570_22955, partial [Bacteroidota bacterium]